MDRKGLDHLRLGVLLFPSFFIILPFLLSVVDRYYQWSAVGALLLLFRVLAILSTLIGVILILAVTVVFKRWGHGTPIPIFPPQKLVNSGLFRHTRNPMYLGYVLVCLGVSLWFGGGLLLINPLLFFFVLNLIVHHHEEPVLFERFGEDFQDYCRLVPRWL